MALKGFSLACCTGVAGFGATISIDALEIAKTQAHKHTSTPKQNDRSIEFKRQNVLGKKQAPKRFFVTASGE